MLIKLPCLLAKSPFLLVKLVKTHHVFAGEITMLCGEKSPCLFVQ
jgi:hypothetical protein